MYYLYCIAYRISDEIKVRKEAEKPFWWDHLHTEVKEQTIEDVEKDLLEGQISPEKLAEMTKNEKFLVVSQGCYQRQCKEGEQVAAELESLKKDVERSKTAFLNQPNVTPAGTSEVQENLEPIVLGQRPAPGSIPSEGGYDPLAANPGAGASGSPTDSHMKLDDEHLNIVSSNIKDEDLNNGTGGGAASSPAKSDLRKYAQSIVSRTVGDINTKADSIPDDVAQMKEQELLQAVIDELNEIKVKQ